MLEFALVGAASATFILVGHWFPWRKAFGRDLHRVEAYAYGVACIILPAIVAYQLAGTAQATAILLVATFSAGLATLISKAIDAAIDHAHHVKDLEDRLAHVRTIPSDPEA